jgi:hypothetical protein
MGFGSRDVVFLQKHVSDLDMLCNLSFPLLLEFKEIMYTKSLRRHMSAQKQLGLKSCSQKMF